MPHCSFRTTLNGDLM
uniref:Uncharacterized protein n=1 Tax=Anguilla anguilla TaxID=7936 RepID=A0A0E9S736_ANGAN